MRDHIRQILEKQLTENIFSSAVKKDQGRGVEKATGHAIELDMSKPNTNAKVKMAQDSKVVKGLITKGFTHAESSEGGNKVKLYFAGPRQRNTWLKKWRSLDIKDSPTIQFRWIHFTDLILGTMFTTIDSSKDEGVGV